MKTVRIRNTVDSADMLTLNIYHTAITGSNLLTSSVSSSGVFTGADLYKGLEFQVEDDVQDFYIRNLTRCVNIGSGSLGTLSNNVFFYTFGVGSGTGTLRTNGLSSTDQQIYSTPVTKRHNFATHPSFTVDAIPTYPAEFVAWYSNSALTGSAISTDDPLTFTSGSFSGSLEFYAKFE